MFNPIRFQSAPRLSLEARHGIYGMRCIELLHKPAPHPPTARRAALLRHAAENCGPRSTGAAPHSPSGPDMPRTARTCRVSSVLAGIAAALRYQELTHSCSLGPERRRDRAKARVLTLQHSYLRTPFPLTHGLS